MTNPQSAENLDVVAINIRTGLVIWTDGPHDKEDAKAVVGMAIMRQGVDDRFFVTEPHGTNVAGQKAVRSGGRSLSPEPRGPRGLASQRGGK